MSDFYPLQARALSYTGNLSLANNTWHTIAQASNTTHDVLIVSLRVMFTATAASGFFEIAIEDGTGSDTKKIFRAEGNGEYYPQYQVFSKDSPCYLSQTVGNAERIRLYKSTSVLWYVSFVNFASTTGNQSWGALT